MVTDFESFIEFNSISDSTPEKNTDWMAEKISSFLDIDWITAYGRISQSSHAYLGQDRFNWFRVIFLVVFTFWQ